MREVFGAEFDVPDGYLNTASIGVPSVAVADAVADAVAGWRTGAARPPQYDQFVEAARSAWARLVGVGTEHVASGASVSQLAGLVAASVPDGTRVVTVANEFTSVTFPFAAQEKRGVTVTEVAPANLAEAAADADLVAVSVVQSADGALADLDELRRTGTPVFLDATQAVGWLPLRLDWADYVVGGSYKWLFAPRGAAWLAVHPNARPLVPHVANWYGAADIWDGVYGLPLRLADTVLTEMGREPAGSAIISLALTADQRERLAEADIVSSVRAGRTRLSFHLYNSEDDVDRVLGALATRPGR